MSKQDIIRNLTRRRFWLAVAAFVTELIVAFEGDAVQDRYKAGARAMMDAGIVPSANQLASIDWTPEQYWVYRTANRG